MYVRLFVSGYYLCLLICAEAAAVVARHILARLTVSGDCCIYAKLAEIV